MQHYVYSWKNNERRAKLHGKVCRILSTGPAMSALIEFVSTGEQEVVSRRALRRVKPCPVRMTYTDLTLYDEITGKSEALPPYSPWPQPEWVRDPKRKE